MKLDNKESFEEQNVKVFWEESFGSNEFWLSLNCELNQSDLNVQPGSCPSTWNPTDPPQLTSAGLLDQGLFEEIPSQSWDQDLWTSLNLESSVLGKDSSISTPEIHFSGRNDAVSSMPDKFTNLEENNISTNPILLGQDVSFSLEEYFSAFPTISATTSGSSPAASEFWVPEDVNEMGYQDEHGNWRCRYSGCISEKLFMRACDLRKHFRGHLKSYFCDEKACPSLGIGFSSRKDYQRHMRSHKPGIP